MTQWLTKLYMLLQTIILIDLKFPHFHNQQAKGHFVASNAYRHLFSPLFPSSIVWWHIIYRHFLNKLKNNLKAN